VWPLNCVADGELRICIPVLDLINRQFDKGLKLLMGTGGKGSQIDLTVEIEHMIISASCHCVHNVRPDP
jgi:hypothetical protein